jgi:hypothetical protein
LWWEEALEVAAGAAYQVPNYYLLMVIDSSFDFPPSMSLHCSAPPRPMRLFVMQGVETVSLGGRVSQIFARYNPDHTETVWVCDSV